MAYRLYQKLISAMAGEGIANASDIDLNATLDNQSYSKVSTIINAIISKIQTIVSEVTSIASGRLERSVVQSLPTTDISDHTIYLVPKTNAATRNIYDECMYINGAWEKIGDTEIDLTNYVQKPSSPTTGAVYVYIDGELEPLGAYEIPFSDNGFLSTNVQDAIVEVRNENNADYTNLENRKVSYPASVTDNKQYVMYNGQWVEVQIATDAESITYSGDIPGVANVKAALDALDADVSDAESLVTDIKNAQGQEVGDVAETDIAEGALIWHGGKLYRVLSLIVAGDRWQDMDVTETSVSGEINAMRGVSTEGVYLTITPASAIPVEGVKARIYNEASQTYLDEVTFTPASNRHLLGQIAYGDVYTIIMPSIDGYTQPADQTFKAGQMLRQRTVEYIPTSEPTYEALTINLACLDGSVAPSSTVVVRLYDGNTLVSTHNLTTTNGKTETINIPLGMTYYVTAPNISGYTLVTAASTFKAKLSQRNLVYRYIALSSSFYWIMSDGTYVSGDTDPYDISWSDVAAIATNLSTLFINGVNYNFIIEKRFLASGSNISAPWMNPSAVTAAPMYSSDFLNDVYGESNTAIAADLVDEQAGLGNTYTSAMKMASVYADFSINGITQRCYIPAYGQISRFITSLKSVLVNILQNVFSVTPNGALGSSDLLTSTQFNNTQCIKVKGNGGTSALDKANNMSVIYVATILQYEND